MESLLAHANFQVYLTVVSLGSETEMQFQENKCLWHFQIAEAFTETTFNLLLFFE